MKRNYLIMTAAILCALSIAACGTEDKGGKNGNGTQTGETQESVVQTGEMQESSEQAGETHNSSEQAGETHNSSEQTGEMQDNGEQTGDSQTAAGNINVRIDEGKDEYMSEDGTLLLTVHTAIPVVAIADNEAASAAINGVVKDYDLMGVAAEEAREWAEEDYETRGKDNWYEGYVMDTSFAAKRQDSAVISFGINAYSYMGGAHPNAVEAGINFNPNTGERLTLADITVDESAARERIMAYILEEVKRMQAEEEGMFFEDYEENIGDILTEETWYLDKDGLHVIGNEYIISPHAAGILDFVIPYEKADFIKEEYR